MGEWIKMPYAYRAAVLPGRAYRVERHEWFRADILVEVPEFGRCAFEPAFALPRHRHVNCRSETFDDDGIILQKNGRLYAPFRVRNRLAGLDQAVAALGEPQVIEKGEEEDGALLHGERLAYPIRLVKEDAREFTPLMVRSIAQHALFEGWSGPVRVVASDRNDREASAAATLADAVALVDGIFYIRCVEPALRVAHRRGRRYALVVETMPWVTGADQFFRLDRHREALAWASRYGVKPEPEDVCPPIKVPDASLLRRSDLLEMGRCALMAWPEFRGQLFAEAHVFAAGEACAEALDRMVSERRALDEARACEILDALEGVLSGSSGIPNGWRLCWVRQILARAKAERDGAARDLFSWQPPSDVLSDEDLAALAGI